MPAPAFVAAAPLQMGDLRLGRVHLVGAAGSGMRALADILAALGTQLSGSDMRAEARTLPWPIVRGHDARTIGPDIDLVVHSAAIEPSNVELRAARDAGIPILSYPQMLGRIMAGRRGVAIAGTHGKSTIAAMTSAILCHAGLDPSCAFGATPCDAASGGRFGRGKIFLAEACEYRAHFLELRPAIITCTAIEWDHVDFFRDRQHCEQTFAEFFGRLPADGLALYQAGCPALARATTNAACPRETFGFERSCDWVASQLAHRLGRYTFELCHRSRRLGVVTLRVPGRHNVINALAAAATAYRCGASSLSIVEALARFGGVERRTQSVGGYGGVTIIDDFAHHPSEIRAALAALRQMYPARRIVCLFQPHQVSRTKALLDGLADSLQNADVVILDEIFSAREAARDAHFVEDRLISRTRELGAKVVDPRRKESLLDTVIDTLCVGDVLIVMGAGDIGKIVHGISDGLRTCRAAG